VDWSWTWKDKANPGMHVNWLKDSVMLPAVVPKSRIMAYNYNSRWHSNAPKTRLQLCGEDLVHSIHRFHNEMVNCPIIFIGHSFGGNVIQHVSP
jgi:predicted alpha/beta-fold hydrolase